MAQKALMVAAKLVLFLILGVLLQVLVISRVSVLGVTADLFLVLTVIVAVTRGALLGTIFGFVAGVLADIAYHSPLGMHAFIYVLVGYSVGMFALRVGLMTPWTVLLLGGVVSFSSQLVFGLFQYTMGPRADFFSVVASQMVPEMVLDALLTMLVFVVFVRLRILPPCLVTSSADRKASE